MFGKSCHKKDCEGVRKVTSERRRTRKNTIVRRNVTTSRYLVPSLILVVPREQIPTRQSYQNTIFFTYVYTSYVEIEPIFVASTIRVELSNLLLVV